MHTLVAYEHLRYLANLFVEHVILKLTVHQEHTHSRWSKMMGMIGLLQSSSLFWRDVGSRQEYA